VDSPAGSPTKLVATVPSGGTWTGANSLLVNTINIPSGFQNQSSTCATPSSGLQIFVNGGDGYHYLKDGTYREKGITDIDATLLAELPQKTTHPPIDLPVEFKTSGSMTFFPQIQRFAAGTQPDLGYYYDALDYTVSYMILDNGAQLTVLPGTAIGVRFDWVYGFIPASGSTFISQGMPTKPITYAPISLVQEGPFLYGVYPGFTISFAPEYWPYEDYNPQGDPPPALDFRFSDFCLSSGLGFHFWTGMPMRFFSDFWRYTPITSAMDLSMRDCSMHGGWLHFGEPNGNVVTPVDYGGPTMRGSICWLNSLFDRVNISVDPDTGRSYWGSPHDYTAPTVDVSLVASNNLFHGGWLFLQPVNLQPGATEGAWAFTNNMFDKVVFSQDAEQPLDHDFNAYWRCTQDELTPGQQSALAGAFEVDTALAHNRKWDAAPPYQPGPLGDFYIDNSTHTVVYQAGSCTPAEAGLFHYTTSSSQQTKEATAPKIDIGLHYIAVNPTGANAGQPQDYDLDGKIRVRSQHLTFSSTAFRARRSERSRSRRRPNRLTAWPTAA